MWIGYAYLEDPVCYWWNTVTLCSFIASSVVKIKINP